MQHFYAQHHVLKKKPRREAGVSDFELPVRSELTLGTQAHVPGVRADLEKSRCRGAARDTAGACRCNRYSGRRCAEKPGDALAQAPVADFELDIEVANRRPHEVMGKTEGFAGGQTADVQNANIAVNEPNKPMFLFQAGVDLRQIVDAINQVGASPSALIAILEALKSSGSLRAELVVI